MAFDPTKLLEARGKIEDAMSGKLNANNLRIPYFGAAEALLKGGPMLIKDMVAQKKSDEQPIKLPVFNRVAPGTETLRKCSGTGTGSTAYVQPVFQGITEDFSLSDLEQAGNEVGRDLAFAYLLSQKARNIYARLDTIGLGFLEANKATVNRGTYFDTTLANAKRVPYEYRDELFAGIEAEMRDNTFYGSADIVAGNNMKAVYDNLMAQGSNNGTNKQYQLGNFNPYFTSVPKGPGVFDTAYAFEAGTAGMFTWLRPLFRKGRDIGTDVWMTMKLPALPGMSEGLEVEVKVKYGCVGEADYVESYVLHVDVATLGAYAETTGDSGIYKYELLRRV
jgi:hypothetical protein